MAPARVKWAEMHQITLESIFPIILSILTVTEKTVTGKRKYRKMSSYLLKNTEHFSPWLHTSTLPHPSPTQMEVSRREEARPFATEEKFHRGQCKIQRLHSATSNLVKNRGNASWRSHTLLRNSLRTTSLLTWKSSTGIWFIFNLAVFRKSTVCRKGKLLSGLKMLWLKQKC